MDIIAKRAPTIDPATLELSLQRFRDYIVETLELIDFTLSNQKTRIVGAVSQDNFEALESAVSALASSVNGLGGTVATLGSNLATVRGDLGAVEQDVTALGRDVAALEESNALLAGRIAALESWKEGTAAALASLEARVAALEGGTT